MLDEYMNQQKIVYKTLTNAVKKNKYSHAYLFESNGNQDTFKIVLAFAKMLLCPNNYSNNLNCVKCTQCHRIDNNCFEDIKIIDADGMWIKKEQLDELQKSFNTKSIEANKKIYIINNAEKLNLQSANSILKFLEEPEEGIIALLITNNIYQLLNTIVSRCQIISLAKSKKQNKLDNLLPEDEYIDDLETINKFVKYLEKEKTNTILMTQNLWHDRFKERIKFNLGFELLLLYYKDILNLKINRRIEYFEKYIDTLDEISKKNSIEKLVFKINKIIELKEYIKINANQNLLLDKLILEIMGDE